MRKEIQEIFGNKLRLRVCGILIKNKKVLLIRHQGISETDSFWAPPGGGVSFGTSAIDALVQEFHEETGLIISVKELLFVNEFHHQPLHAIELFFEVEQIGGNLYIGFDPELPDDQQIIKEVRYFDANDLMKHQGAQFHGVFNNIKHPEQLLNLKGYFQNWK